MKKTLIIIMIAIGLFLAIMISIRIANYNKLKKVKSEDIVLSVGTQTLTKEKIVKKIQLQSIVEGDPQIKIYPGVSGKFSYNTVKEGDFIEKDQTITFIDRDIIGASFNLASVKSPISGMVIKLYYHDKGSNVTPDKPIAEIANTSKVKMVVNLGEEDLLSIKKNAQVDITSAYNDSLNLDGYVESVTPFIDRDSMSGTIIITADNKNKILKVGMSVNLNVITDTYMGYTVPERAVIMGQDKLIIYKNVSGIAKEVIVKTGYSSGEKIEISGDLKDGDQIIVDGNFKIYDGAKINIVE